MTLLKKQDEDQSFVWYTTQEIALEKWQPRFTAIACDRLYMVIKRIQNMV